MALRTRKPAEVFFPRPPDGPGGPLWPTEVAQLLEEHHLVAWSHTQPERDRFGATLAEYLGSLAETEVCVLHGRLIGDLVSLHEQLARCAVPPDMPADAPASIDGPHGLLALLRRRWGDGAGASIKRRYYIWNDADAMLRRDPAMFGRVVDAMTGVAAEAEYASEDLLLIHRAVFIGGPALDVYAEDPRGQFRSWLREEGERPFWEVVSGLKRPSVLPYHIATVD